MKNVFIKMTALLLAVFSAQALENKSTVNKCTQYHNRMCCFNLIHQCYERIKNHAFYAGVEGWIAPTSKDVIGEAEFRTGYNFFFNEKDHLRPLVGIGVFKDFEEKKSYCVKQNQENFEVISKFSHRRPLIVYGTMGFIYDHEFNSIFNLGLNAKALFGGPVKKIKEKDIVISYFNWGKTIVGVDASMPLTFRFGRNRHWDIRLEPFNIYIHGQENSMNYFGVRNILGYRF